MRVLLVILLGLLLAACEPAPQPIRYGEDVCAHCRMTVSDERFGAELVTTTGKAHPFDSIECLAEYVGAHIGLEERTHSLWVTSFDAPGTLIPLDDAFFTYARDLHSPMGRGLAAFGPATDQREALALFDDAEVLTWDAVLTLVDRPIQVEVAAPDDGLSSRTP